MNVAMNGEHVITAIELNITLSTIHSTTTGLLHAELYVIANNFWTRIGVLISEAKIVLSTSTGNNRLRIRQVSKTEKIRNTLLSEPRTLTGYQQIDKLDSPNELLFY